MDQEKMKMVYTIVERGANKAHWVRVGVGFVNQDGSINLKLDAIPTNGTLQIREWEPRDERSSGGNAGGYPPRDQDGRGARPARPPT